MSWSVYFTCDADNFQKASELAADKAIRAGAGKLEEGEISDAGVIPPEQLELGEDAISAALSAAKDLVSRGVVGKRDRLFRVNVNGHANKNHAPDTNWANDFVTIQVTQTDPEVTA